MFELNEKVLKLEFENIDLKDANAKLDSEIISHMTTIKVMNGEMSNMNDTMN